MNETEQKILFRRRLKEARASLCDALLLIAIHNPQYEEINAMVATIEEIIQP